MSLRSRNGVLCLLPQGGFPAVMMIITVNYFYQILRSEY